MHMCSVISLQSGSANFNPRKKLSLESTSYPRFIYCIAVATVTHSVCAYYTNALKIYYHALTLESRSMALCRKPLITLVAAANRDDSRR